MSWNDPNKLWKCKVCGDIIKAKDMLKAANPFDPDDEILGCPSCKTASGDGEWMELCEREGCGKEATCGTPLKGGGYLRACFKHFKEVDE